MRHALSLVTLFAGYLVGQALVLPHAENHPVRTGLVLVLVLIPSALIALGIVPGTAAFVATIVFFGALGWSWIEGWDNQDNYIDPYCSYGAQTKKQLRSCKAHVNSDDIDKLHTPAAQFARGVIDECGRGSGPYCAEAAKWDRGG